MINPIYRQETMLYCLTKKSGYEIGIRKISTDNIWQYMTIFDSMILTITLNMKLLNEVFLDGRDNSYPRRDSNAGTRLRSKDAILFYRRSKT